MNNNQGRRRTRRARQLRKQKNTQISRILLTICMIALVAVVSIGGTLAWLTDDTAPVVNTFTDSDIEVELTEYGAASNVDGSALEQSFKMVPGATIAKAPYVTYKAGSEAGYVFVEITKNDTYDAYLEDYDVRDAWTRLNAPAEGEDQSRKTTEIYYKEYASLAESEQDAAEYILAKGDGDNANGYVAVKTSVTKAMMNKLESGETTKPTLTFKVYAIQKEHTGTPAEAWAKLNVAP